MSAPTPDPDSPFASFAQPKKSAVEQYKERAGHERKIGKERWHFLGTAFAGTVVGAVAAVTVDVGPLHLPLALAYAVGAALLGVLIGWLLALVTWCSMLFRGKGPGASTTVQSDLVRGNQWSKLSVWMTAWAAIGIVIGAAFGAMLATEPASNEAMETALGWAMGGATTGLTAAVIGWFVVRGRRRVASAGAE